MDCVFSSGGAFRRAAHGIGEQLGRVRARARARPPLRRGAQRAPLRRAHPATTARRSNAARRSKKTNRKRKALKRSASWGGGALSSSHDRGGKSWLSLSPCGGGGGGALPHDPPSRPPRPPLTPHPHPSPTPPPLPPLANAGGLVDGTNGKRGGSVDGMPLAKQLEVYTAPYPYPPNPLPP